jgi:hypothetical protein
MVIILNWSARTRDDKIPTKVLDICAATSTTASDILYEAIDDYNNTPRIPRITTAPCKFEVALLLADSILMDLTTYEQQRATGWEHVVLARLPLKDKTPDPELQHMVDTNMRPSQALKCIETLSLWEHERTSRSAAKRWSTARFQQLLATWVMDRTSDDNAPSEHDSADYVEPAEDDEFDAVDEHDGAGELDGGE